MGNWLTSEPSNDQLSASSNNDLSGQPSSKPHLIAAALSASFKRTVVTEEEYERRKHEPLFARAEKLDLQKMADLSFEPATGKFEDAVCKICGRRDCGARVMDTYDKITVRLKSLSGKTIELEVGKDSYVEEVKYLLKKKVTVHTPIHNDRLVLPYRGKQMQEGRRISYYGVRKAMKRYKSSMTLSYIALLIPCRLAIRILLNSQPHSGLVLTHHLLWMTSS